MQARVRFAGCARNPLRRSCVSSARNAGESAIRPAVPAQPSAEIVRVECAKCRRECDLSTCARNPLRRSCVSSARNAGESAICRNYRATLCGDRACRVREMQARVRFVKCRATLCGDRACRVREMQARARFVKWPAQPSAEIVRVECAKCRRECDLWKYRTTLCGDSTTLVRSNLWSWKRRTGDFVVQL